jgi:glycosyltransferase involved in cell wall biosynthesis
MNIPLISIGMPVYNEAKFIQQTLNSVLSQIYMNFELIISDNASTDNTFEICQAYAARDKRITVLKQPSNLGSGINFIKVLEKAKGRYFSFVSGHDLWHPNFLHRCIEILSQNSSIVLCFPQAVSIDKENRTLGIWSASQMDTMGLDPISRLHITLWTAEYMFPFCGVYCLPTFKKLYSSQNTKVVTPDNLLIAELSLHGFFYYIKEPLLYLRQNRDNEQDTTPAYIERIYGKPLSEMSSYQINGETIQQFIRMLANYIQDKSEFNRVALSVINCLITRRHFKVVFNNVICSNPNNEQYPNEWDAKFPNLYALFEKFGVNAIDFLFKK